MVPAARFRCNDHALGGAGERDVGAKDRRYTPAGENTAGVSGAWSRRGKKAPRVHRESSRRCGVPSRAVRSREEPTGVPANYDGIINKDYRLSRNVRWKREPPPFQRSSY